MLIQYFVFVLGFLCSTIFAASPAIHEYHLDNGLKLIVKEDHRSPVVLSSIWYKVGGSYEHNGLTGISHVLEHMMFRGTTQYPAGDLDRMISSVGGQQNAMTTNDYTMYYQLLPANQLALSFELEADRMQNLVIKQSDFNNEIQVVMEERRMRFDDNPQALTWERFMAAAFVNNPYHHQTIGWMTDLENMTYQNVRDWYRTWYQPNNAIVVVVGDVDANQVLSLAKKYYGAIAKKAVPVLKPRTEIASLGTIRVNVQVPANVPFLIMGYRMPTLATSKKADQIYALDVLSSVLGGTNSSRLQNDLVRTAQLLSNVEVSYDAFELHGTALQIFVTPMAGKSIAECEAAILKEIQRIKTEKISVDELERVKAQMIASKVYGQDSVQEQAMLLGTPEMIGLPWFVGENYVEQIKRMTPEQVQQAAQRFLQNKALTIAILHPESTAKQQPQQNLVPKNGDLYGKTVH
ncbi:MAG: peptidase M16 [Coxiella sp. RIFCSPHIGHO2_12_FULL_42_15]|nr:MAG: peptidase M16 [Coxiella sp. RIFCSPHIGHO2_12_FULL_42_15]